MKVVYYTVKTEFQILILKVSEKHFISLGIIVVQQKHNLQKR